MRRDREVFAANLLTLVQATGKTREQLAVEIGEKAGLEVSVKWLRRVCREGISHTSRRTSKQLQAVADFFEVELEQLWMIGMATGESDCHRKLSQLIKSGRHQYLVNLIELLWIQEEIRAGRGKSGITAGDQ